MLQGSARLASRWSIGAALEQTIRPRPHACRQSDLRRARDSAARSAGDTTPKYHWAKLARPQQHHHGKACVDHDDNHSQRSSHSRHTHHCSSHISRTGAIAVPFHQTWTSRFFSRLCRWSVVRGSRSFAGVARPKCLRPSARGSRPLWRGGRGLRARCAPHLRAHAHAKGLQGCPREGGHLGTPRSTIVATKTSFKIR